MAVAAGFADLACGVNMRMPMMVVMIMVVIVVRVIMLRVGMRFCMIMSMRVRRVAMRL